MFTQLAYQFNTNPQLDDDQGYEEVPTVKCPFDSSHMMQPKNYLTHIYRCGSPNKSLYVQCKYDPCHWIYPQERQKHHQQCQTRIQHYKDMDIQEGDWDQQQMQRRIEQKMKKQKRQKMKQKLRKLYNYLKQKKIQEKRIKQEMKNNPSTQISRHTQRTRQLSQYEVDKFSSFSEIKRKLKNFIHKKGVQKSMVKSQKIHPAKQNINIQPPKSCYDGAINKLNNLPLSPTNIQLPPKQFSLQPFQIQLQPISQFPTIPPLINGFRPQYPPNIQSYPPVPLHVLQNQSFPVNYMPPNTYPLNYLNQHYNPFMPQLTPPIPQLYYANGTPYQQPWDYQTNVSSFRQKPKPETSLQFDVDASTQDFIKKTFTEGDLSQKSDEKIKISSQVQDTPYVPTDMYLNYPDYTNYYANYRQFQYNMDVKPKKKYVQKQKTSQFIKQSEKTKTKDDKQKYHNGKDKKQNSQKQSEQKKKKKKQQKQGKQQKKQKQRLQQKQRQQKKQRQQRKLRQQNKQKQQKRQKQKKQKQQKKNEKKQKKQSKKKQFNEDYSLIFSNTKTQQSKDKHKQNRKKNSENKSKQADKSQNKKKSNQKQQKHTVEQIKTKQTAHPINYQQYQDPARFQPYMYQPTFPHNMQPIIHPPIQSTFTKKQQIPQFTPVLDNSISAYDFQPFQHSMNMTIKNESFKFHDKSQFLQMKQMLSILDKGDTNNKKKQCQGGYQNENKKAVYKQKRDFGYNNYSNKR